MRNSNPVPRHQWIGHADELREHIRTSSNVRSLRDKLDTSKAVVVPYVDGYTMIGVNTTQGLRIRCGCRRFTLAEARKHWGRSHYSYRNRKEIRAALALVVAVAKARGWKLTATRK